MIGEDFPCGKSFEESPCCFIFDRIALRATVDTGTLPVAEDALGFGIAYAAVLKSNRKTY
jgi:hypothetical protein